MCYVCIVDHKLCDLKYQTLLLTLNCGQCIDNYIFLIPNVSYQLVGVYIMMDTDIIGFLVGVIVIWRFNSMAIPGFQEQLESRIKKYYLCTVRLLRGYRFKNYFIPP